MQSRTDFYTASPDALKAMIALETAVSKLPLEKNLIELVKLRASQINGCAFCIDMHTADAIKGGETSRRLFAVTAWREAPFFTERERAALLWTESLTQLSLTHAPDEDYDVVAAQFSPKEMVDLTVAISTINSLEPSGGWLPQNPSGLIFRHSAEPQWASALGAAGGCTLRIKGTMAVAMMKQTMIIRNASP
jgi:AhpD family alkylhydroperoxidase